MTETNASSARAKPLPVWVDRLTPRTGVRVQLFSAAIMWAIGLGFLLVRGVLFMRTLSVTYHDTFWLVPIVLLAVVVGIIKAQYILIRYANKAIARIRGRGRACYFGFFGWSSWAFILVMMGGGVMLRHSVLATVPWGLAFLAVLYIAVGTGLAIADRIFWIAAFAPVLQAEAQVSAE